MSKYENLEDGDTIQNGDQIYTWGVDLATRNVHMREVELPHPRLS